MPPINEAVNKSLGAQNILVCTAHQGVLHRWLMQITRSFWQFVLTGSRIVAQPHAPQAQNVQVGRPRSSIGEERITTGLHNIGVLAQTLYMHCKQNVLKTKTFGSADIARALLYTHLILHSAFAPSRRR